MADGGAGMAEALGAGILAYLDGELKPGFEIVKETTNLIKIFEWNKIDSVISIMDKPMDLDQAMENGKKLLYSCIENHFKLLDSLNCLY